MDEPQTETRYGDIIGLTRPVSAREPMPLEDRAAQFSPFAALNGHEEALAETEERVRDEM